MKLKTNKVSDTFNWVYTGIVIFVFALIAVSCFFNMGRSDLGYNRDVLQVFGVGSVVALGGALMFAFFQFANFGKKKLDGKNIPFAMGHVAETNDYNPISKNLFARIGIHAAWIMIVIIMAAGFGFEIWQAPNTYSNVQEFSSAGNSEALATFGIADSLWNIAVLPGFTEDMAAFMLSAFIVMVIQLWRFIMLKTTKSNFFTFNWLWYYFSIIVACPIAAYGLGFVPGFVMAHANVAQGNIAFLLTAWIFQVVNLIVMWITGLWLPIAHIAHNGIFALGFSLAFSIAAIAIPIWIKKRRMI